MEEQYIHFAISIRPAGLPEDFDSSKVDIDSTAEMESISEGEGKSCKRHTKCFLRCFLVDDQINN